MSDGEGGPELKHTEHQTEGHWFLLHANRHAFVFRDMGQQTYLDSTRNNILIVSIKELPKLVY